jgi:peptide deformylase
VSAVPIHLWGDPLLRQRTPDVEEIDGSLVALADTMIDTMYEAPGVGLAANQVGIAKRLFVYDVGDGPAVVVNPRITESDGEWVYEEGCLSIPGLSWDLVRPNRVLLVGLDLDGNELEIEASELEGRCFQHEVDHLDGILVLERLEDDLRKEALRTLRTRVLDEGGAPPLLRPSGHPGG